VPFLAKHFCQKVKKYQNATTLAQVTAKNVGDPFLRRSVVAQRRSGQSTMDERVSLLRCSEMLQRWKLRLTAAGDVTSDDVSVRRRQLMSEMFSHLASRPDSRPRERAIPLVC